jgi:hypothetical protein
MHLKSCPLCLAPARRYTKKGVTGLVAKSRFYREWVSCTNKKCGLTTQRANRPSVAVALWNTRTPADPVPNTETAAAMREVQSGDGTRFDSVDDLMADLNDAGPAREGLADEAQRLQDHMEQHHGITLAASEWDRAVTALRHPMVTNEMVERGSARLKKLIYPSGRPFYHNTTVLSYIARAVLTAALGGDDDPVS